MLLIMEEIHTLMSLLDMVQMDMGQGFHTMMRLLIMVQLYMGRGSTP